MMTAMPARLKIGRHWWTVEAVDSRRIRYGSYLVRGLCYYLKRHIQVCMRQGERKVRETLCHELIHAMCFEAGVTLEESEVHALEPVFAAMLWKNPKLVRALSAAS